MASASDGLAVVAYRDDGVWRCEELPRTLLRNLDACLDALRRQPGDGFGCVFANVDDEFFVALRSTPGGEERLLLSDVTAAVDYELARSALEFLDEEPPTEDELDDVWPIGDLSIFSDLGLGERELRAILDDLDLYADDMIAAIAARAGFADAYAAVVGNPPLNSLT
ncbi:MAG TPA: tRNA adenosine deaminase-associated protein [Mycobacteriales bacterium]|jgi:putative tRNA adenosine deaminase-associated protein|nr:tRNA adenosine deaminase-associated protein [Mycobacteriales bacterium]